MTNTTRQFNVAGVLQSAAVALSLVAATAAQSPIGISVSFVKTGLRPMGIGVATVPVAGLGSALAAFTVVANSGDNSVSIYGDLTLSPKGVVTGIPSPYAVAGCSNGTVLVTSPSDNSVWVLGVTNQGTAGVRGRVSTGPQPYAVSCSGVVSNVGDNTLTVFDPSSLNVLGTIVGVPGSRGFHGIASGWVAGTDANVVTVVDLAGLKVLTQIPVSRPTAVLVGPSNYIYIASAGTGSITAYDAVSVSQVPNVQFQSVPNPQDLVFSALGNFAISAGATAGQESLWKFDLTSNPSNTGPVASIPGAAALGYLSPTRGNVTASNTLVFATSTSTNSVYSIHQADFVRDFIISNGASFDQAQVASGSLVSMFVATGVSQSLKVSSLPLPATLGGVILKIGGSLNFDTPSNKWAYSSTGAVQAPLLFVGPNQINLQLPPGIAPGSAVPAQLTKPDGTTSLSIINITASAAGIFSLSQDGRFQGAVLLNDDFSQNGSPQLIAGAKPAVRGSVIQIFATGAGGTNPPVAAGVAAPGNPLALTVAQPTVTIGGKTAAVQFSGLAPGFVGLWQINAVVPAEVTPGNAVSLSITAGGQTSNTVTIAVQ